MIPDPREKPTLTVEEADQLFQLGRSKAYEEAQRWLATDGPEGLPVIRFGRTLRVPTATALRRLGLAPETNEPPAATRGSHLNVVAAGLPSQGDTS